MAEETRANRRLVAVMSSDVVGYSRMMGADETGTLAALKRHRESIFDPEVAHYHGRVVKLMGDGALVEFPSVVDAVSCAVAVQRTICTQSRPGGIALRIGINLGDVIIDGEDIYGDGVNVAARLEPLADAGGVCVSNIVHESIGGRIGVHFQDGGEVSAKNIAKPIRIWKWHPDREVPAVQGEASLTVAEKRESERPSIAVLPFDNMSGDPDQQYFSDGITEDIITDLSKVGGLLVIARNSSFAYKGRNPDIRVVGRELGVRSVLEGSIRRAGNRVRITAQLIKAADGTHLWGERYDRDMTDIFAVQDEVTQRIVEALEVTLAPGEAARLSEIPTRSIDAHDLFLRGRELLYGKKKDREMFEEVVSLMRRAIEMDPGYADAYAGLAMAYEFDAQNHWSGAADSRELAVHFSDMAVAIGPTVPYAQVVAAVSALWTGDLERSKRACEAALAISPNYALAYGARGLVAVYSGNPLSAIPDIEMGIRLDPAHAQQYIHFLGSAYLVAGKYETAAAVFRERVRVAPDTDLSRGLLISALGHLGETAEAKQVWSDLKRANPKYSFTAHVARLPFRNGADMERIKAGFAAAGVSE